MPLSDQTSRIHQPQPTTCHFRARLGLAGLVLLAACSAKEAAPPPMVMRAPAPVMSKAAQPEAPAVEAAVSAEAGVTDTAPVRRFLAVHHTLQLEMEEDALPQAWRAIEAFCNARRCEILSANLRQKSEHQPPSANQSLRLAPEQFPALLSELAKVGEIIEHRTESEDKTATVIDTEARIRNLTELRDRLRQMLAGSRGSMREMIELERELSRVQTELDSAQTLRRTLANQTEKVAVDISYQARRGAVGRDTFAPLHNAWQDAGHTLAQSFAAVILFVAALLPWLLTFIPAFFLLRKGWRHWQAWRQARRGQKNPPRTTEPDTP